MKEIKFNKLTIQRFMSVGDDKVVIDFEEGINFITGYNEDQSSYNGVGKTTIINAFFFALFGSLYGDNSSKVKKADVVNNIIGGTAIVTLSLFVDDDEYQIVRSINPSKVSFKLMEDGKELDDLSKTIPETNADICTLIEGDSDVYASTVVMDSDSKCFLTKDPTKKIKFIESVTGLEVFATMLKNAKSELTQANKLLGEETAKLDQLESLIKREGENKNNFAAKQQLKVDNITQDIVQLKTRMVALEDNAPVDQTPEITLNEEKLEVVADRSTKAQVAKAKAEAGVSTVASALRDSKSELSGIDNLVCVTCNRPMEGHSAEEIELSKQKIILKMSGLEEDLIEARDNESKLGDGISKLGGIKNTLTTHIRALKQTQDKFNSFSKELDSFKNEVTRHEVRIDEIKEEENPLGNTLKELEADKNVAETKVSDGEGKVEILEYVKYLCSPEGVKAHILSKIVKLFNTTLNEYLVALNSPCSIQFDEFFDAVIKNEKNKEISYNSLSGGERKRVDVSLLFTFRDLRRIQSNISINVSMFDELFDSALCSAGGGKIMDILSEQAQENNECIYIITHRMGLVDDVKSNTINLIKKNGVTKRVEDDYIIP